MALNAGVHTHDISILTTSSSCALKETSINELVNYKSLVSVTSKKGAVVTSNQRETFKIWFLIVQFVEDVSAGRSCDRSVF